MNRIRKVIAGAAFGAMAAGAQAQFHPAWEDVCYSSTDTTTAIYSTDYGRNVVGNSLFRATTGLSGTVYFGKNCYVSGANVPVVGGLGFGLGSLGSVQDGGFDDFMELTMGMPNAPACPFSYAMTVRQAQDGTGETKSRFGANGLSAFYVGASDNYMIVETTNDSIFVQLRVDVIGDTARCQWSLTNTTTTPYKVGLMYGAWAALLRNNFDNTDVFGYDRDRLYVTTPGHKPLSIQTRYVRTGSDTSQHPPKWPMVPYANFAWSQANAWGLHVVNSPSDPFASVSDQTSVDQFDIGSQSFILGSPGGFTSTMPDTVFDDLLFSLGFGGAGCAFLQRWDPTGVSVSSGGAAATRTIVAYYRSTNAFSDYERPYSAVIDGPRVVALSPSDPYSFSPNPGVIRVYIDNTRGFTTVDREVPLDDIRVTLDLPAGIGDASDITKTRITKFIAEILPRETGFVDFPIQYDNNTLGPKTYTVTITPNPGKIKTITGSMNIAAQPRLFVQATTTGTTALLVGSPWNYADTSWATILSGRTLHGGDATLDFKPDRDFQTWTWDATLQEYVIQTSPQRGKGSFIVANPTSRLATDAALIAQKGVMPLDGGPSTPGDYAKGAALINLKLGWNLIANPYNYAFQMGQLVGVLDRGTTAYTFQELTAQGKITGNLAYWDAITQSYLYITGLADFVQPNAGYWLFANEPLTLEFPPVFDTFIPAGTGGISGNNKTWQMQVIASQPNTKAFDSQAFINYVDTKTVSKSLFAYKPPMSPLKNAISTGFDKQVGRSLMRLAKTATNLTGTQTWAYSVETRAAGAVKLTFPNMRQLPAALRVRLYEQGSTRFTDLRSNPTYVYSAAARSTKVFKIVIDNIGR